MKNGSTTIIQRRENHGDHLAIFQHRQPNIYEKKNSCCVIGGLGVVYYELLKPNETITGALYRTQLMRLSRAFKEKRAHYYSRHNKIILLHDNARPYVAAVKTYLETLKWEVLPHPPYSPDIAPSNYHYQHLFRSMTHGLFEQHFTSYDDTKNCIDDWIASKDEAFFRRGIHMLSERWEKIVARPLL